LSDIMHKFYSRLEGNSGEVGSNAETLLSLRDFCMSLYDVLTGDAVLWEGYLKAEGEETVGIAGGHPIH